MRNHIKKHFHYFSVGISVFCSVFQYFGLILGFSIFSIWWFLFIIKYFLVVATLDILFKIRKCNTAIILTEDGKSCVFLYCCKLDLWVVSGGGGRVWIIDSPCLHFCLQDKCWLLFLQGIKELLLTLDRTLIVE